MRQIEKLNAYFDARLCDKTLPVLGYSVTAVENGRIIYERQGGFQRFSEEQPEKNVKMNAETRCRIASVSKQFTAVAVLQMADLGKLDLDRDVSDYLGFPLRNPHFPEAVITARMLLSHVSSLRDGSCYTIPSAFTLRDLFLPEGRYWRNGDHFAAPMEGYNAAPGFLYTYCNLNYGVLGTLVEILSGERFDLYERDHVLRPMGIRAEFNPGLFSPEEMKNLSPIYRRKKDGVFAVDRPWRAECDDYEGKAFGPDLIYISNPDFDDEPTLEDISGYHVGGNATIFSPQGGLRISTKELTLFQQMLMNGGVSVTGERILSENAVKEMLTPCWIRGEKGVDCAPGSPKGDYCCGPYWIRPAYGDYVMEGRDDVVIMGHTGSASGLFSGCFYDPYRKIGYAYAYNGLGASPDNYPGKFTGKNILQETTIAKVYEYLFD